MEYVIVCPQCYSRWNRGVRGCIGCQAEVHDGTSQHHYGFVLMTAVLLGIYTGTRLNSTAGWVVLIGVALADGLGVTHFLRKRVSARITPSQGSATSISPLQRAKFD